MPLMDEFREEREALKHGTPKEKLQYFWDYYKWHTIGIIIGIICIVSFVRSIVTAKEPALVVAMLNCAPLGSAADEMNSEYAEFAGIDQNEYGFRFDTDCILKMNSYDQSTANTIQKLMVSIAAADLDAMMGTGDAFAYYANNQVFRDLRDILTAEQIAAYEPDFYYIDKFVTEEIQRLNADMQDTSGLEIPDPQKPEEMVDPVPVAIYVNNEKLNNSYYFQGFETGVIIGTFANAKHPENTLAFIDYLMQQ